MQSNLSQKTGRTKQTRPRKITIKKCSRKKNKPERQRETQRDDLSVGRSNVERASGKHRWIGIEWRSDYLTGMVNAQVEIGPIRAMRWRSAWQVGAVDVCPISFRLRFLGNEIFGGTRLFMRFQTFFSRPQSCWLSSQADGIVSLATTTAILNPSNDDRIERKRRSNVYNSPVQFIAKPTCNQPNDK